MAFLCFSCRYCLPALYCGPYGRDDANIALLWGIALGLAGLCVLSAASIGMFYVPAALALVFTAVLKSGS